MPWRRLHLRIIDPADKSDGYLDPDVDVEEEVRYPWNCPYANPTLVEGSCTITGGFTPLAL